MSSILVVSPGGAASTGGICRMVRDMVRAWNGGENARRLPMRVIDSGGMTRRSRMAPHFAVSLVRAAIACARGEASLLHVHVAAGGSVLRKGCFVAAARCFGVPALLHMHGADFVEFHDNLSAPLRWAVAALFRRADAVVVLGPRAAAHARHALGVRRERIHVLPNAVPVTDPAQVRGAPGRLRLVFLGALSERKGLDTLLAALASPALAGHDWRLTAVGNGDRKQWRGEVIRLGLAHRVDLPGWMEGEGARALLAGADLLVLPSRQEAMPMAILEAMAAGVPVVATEVGEIPDLVLDGATGLLVPAGDADALAAAIARLLASPAERARLGRCARVRQRAMFALDRYPERLADIYRAAHAASLPAHPPRRGPPRRLAHAAGDAR